MWEKDDEDYQLEISRQKQILIQQKLSQAASEAGKDEIQKRDEEVARLVAENAQKEQELSEKLKKEQETQFNVPKGKTKVGEIITKLTTTQDFLKRIETEEDLNQNKIKEMQPAYSLKDVNQGTRSVVQVSLPSEIYIGMQKKQEIEENKLPDMTPIMDEEELRKLKEEIDTFHDSDMNSTSAILSRLRATGALQSMEFRGRSKDEKPSLPQEEQAEQKNLHKIGSNIKLEYKNQEGKIMTQKEAFRYMCYIFHGKGPGKRKLEKLKKKQILQEKVRQQEVGQNPMLKALAEHQKQTG